MYEVVDLVFRDLLFDGDSVISGAQNTDKSGSTDNDPKVSLIGDDNEESVGTIGPLSVIFRLLMPGDFSR